MPDNYIYSFKYDTHNKQLCKLESRQLFNEEETNNLLFSNIKIDPSISPFIKNRFKIILSSPKYSSLLQKIKNENIQSNGFKAEYMILHGDTTPYTERLNKLKDVGYNIEGDPDYNKPSVIYALCHYGGIWYFGVITKHNSDWFKHKNKPRSYSNAINMDIAKSLVSIASKGNINKRLLDACCGVGTIMLEACISGFDVEGCDINWKACQAARANLAHYNYTANVYRSDIKDITDQYDSAILDLPYNIFSHSDDENTLHIIKSTAERSSHIVIISTTDIKTLIHQAGLGILDSCMVEKKGKKFTRNIWVCERRASFNPAKYQFRLL